MNLWPFVWVLLLAVSQGKNASKHYEVVTDRNQNGEYYCVIKDRESGTVLQDLSSLHDRDTNRFEVRAVSWSGDERHVLIAYCNCRWDDQYKLFERRGESWLEMKLPRFPKCELRFVKPKDSWSSYIEDAGWLDNSRLTLKHYIRIGDWHDPLLLFEATEELRIHRDGTVGRSIIGDPIPFEDLDPSNDERPELALVCKHETTKLHRGTEIVSLFDEVLRRQLGIDYLFTIDQIEYSSDEELKKYHLLEAQHYAAKLHQLYFYITSGSRKVWYVYDLNTGHVRHLLDNGRGCWVIRSVNGLKLRAAGRVLNRLRFDSNSKTRIGENGELVVKLIDSRADMEEEVYVEVRVCLRQSRVTLMDCNVIHR